MSFSTSIISWYTIHKRDLPWRKTKDPYLVWLSEIILQQTKVSQGLPYYESFSKMFPSVADLANASEDEVLKLWEGLGYYSRARNMHHSAKFVIKEMKGIFPVSYQELIQLKGVGDYTASAISSICKGEAKAVLDGNVFRVLARFFGITVPINSTEGLKIFKKIAEDHLFLKDTGTYNQAIMEFGALQCKPRLPNCSNCPLTKKCLAYNTGKVSLLPIKLNKTKVKNRYFNFLVVISSDRKIALEQRSGKGIWQGLYQFPLLETSKSISSKEIMKSSNFLNYSVLETSKAVLFNNEEIIHKLTHQKLHVKFWIIYSKSAPVGAVAIKEIKKYAVPIVVKRFIDKMNL